MNGFAILLLLVLVGLCVFLIVDTTIFIVKKVKLKKQEKQDKENQDTSN